MFRGRRRLDGYRYNPAARNAYDAICSSGYAVQKLADVTENVYGVKRFKHVYTAEGIPYLDSEDLFKLNPEITKHIPVKRKKDAKDYYVQRGWLLMACSGQIYGVNGSVTLAEEWHENKIVSNHAIRVVPSISVRSGYLQIVLGHPQLGRPLVLRNAFGTSVPEISPEDHSEFPVVRLADAAENEIADKAEEASRLRMKANTEEDAAVALVEEFIEQTVGIKLHQGHVTTPLVSERSKPVLTKRRRPRAAS